MAQINIYYHFQVILIFECNALYTLKRLSNSKTNFPPTSCQFPILKEEQNASGRDGDHALSVCRRAENQAADGGEQRLCLSPPPPPVFLYHGGRNGAASPPVTLTVSVMHVCCLPTTSALERPTTHSAHCTKQEGSVVSLSWLVKRFTTREFISDWLPANLAAHQRGKVFDLGKAWDGASPCNGSSALSSVWLHHFCEILLDWWLYGAHKEQNVDLKHVSQCLWQKHIILQHLSRSIYFQNINKLKSAVSVGLKTNCYYIKVYFE